MAKKRKKYRKSKGKFALQANTIYTLTALTLFLGGVLLLISYTRSGDVLLLANEFLVGYFGPLSFLIPFCFMAFAFLFTKLKTKVAEPLFSFGFAAFTLGLMGMFRSGMVGQEMYLQVSSLLGPFLTMFSFFVAAFLGFIAFTNISVGALFGGIGSFLNNVATVTQEKIFPLLKSDKPEMLKDMKPITIKGLNQQPSSSEPIVKENRPELDSNKSSQKDGVSDELVLNKPLEIGVWEYPPVSLLSDQQDKKAERGDVKKIAATIEKTLQSFGIQARVSEINLGPSVTQYAIEIALGTKLSKITGLTNDLALATEAPTGQVRIEAPIPGRNLVGIEIPNKSLELVSLKTMLSSKKMQSTKSKLAIALGLDVSGSPIVTEIGKLPHVLIAGTTGSGKSVMVNTFISSLLFRASPSEVKLILIDPKRVELTMYSDIPHLLTPVVVEPAQAVSALKWALKEMDGRYQKFAEAGVRNLDSYNELAGFQAMPYIVIFIDELADLMAVAAVEVEDSIARLAQMARATGIHLVLATQRPSVDVITGLIKANIPARMAFSVSSGIDSKVILDQPGAEKLLGRGDMLYIPPDQAKPTRIQGSFVSEQDVKRLVNFIKARGIPVQYTTEVTEQHVNIKGMGAGGAGGGNARDPEFEDAVKIVVQHDKASSSLLQRRLQIGFNKAARLVEQLEAAGVVGPADGSKPREVLISNADDFFAQQSTNS
jgi:S-DNA-T family DNA segregation ATPase FtsK/SpoIIIE